jgi:hypothetical protein
MERGKDIKKTKKGKKKIKGVKDEDTKEITAGSSQI